MKTILILMFLNTTNGAKTTIEIPMKDFAHCLKEKKEYAKVEVPAHHKVTKFECMVGAE